MIQLFFGDKRHRFNIIKQSSFLCSEFFKDSRLLFLQKKVSLTHLVLLKQVHGIDGIIIKDKKDIQNVQIRTIEGDFLITNQKQVGLALLTADCLPIVFYDTEKKVIAAAHAGWKGSVLGIGKKVINQMRLSFGSDVKNIKVFFGPAAKVCCYEVSEQFYNNAQDDTLFGQSIIKKKKKFFFDNGDYNKKQLLECGVLQNNICYQQYFCTIGIDRFCSYRQDSGAPARNITVVSLK
jgi:polyphenol oxidase